MRGHDSLRSNSIANQILKEQDTHTNLCEAFRILDNIIQNSDDLSQDLTRYFSGHFYESVPESTNLNYEIYQNIEIIKFSLETFFNAYPRTDLTNISISEFLNEFKDNFDHSPSRFW